VLRHRLARSGSRTLLLSPHRQTRPRPRPRAALDARHPAKVLMWTPTSERDKPGETSSASEPE
jgi:hypothetical protein